MLTVIYGESLTRKIGFLTVIEQVKRSIEKVEQILSCPGINEIEVYKEKLGDTLVYDQRKGASLKEHLEKIKDNSPESAKIVLLSEETNDMGLKADFKIGIGNGKMEDEINLLRAGAHTVMRARDNIMPPVWIILKDYLNNNPENIEKRRKYRLKMAELSLESKWE